MLIPQSTWCETGGGQGGPRIGLAELRRELATPSNVSDGVRQRLLGLARRLARVQSLGDEYAGLALSEHAAAVLRDSVIAP
ncbi:MAG TPA: hypothetical protein VMZ50_07735 [Phycisphaerae bacterium]|nr:hypothetical protein [Phycisphaerae bacterium]